MIQRKRSNPWLSIPAADYEGHMGSPQVAQLEFLSRIFGELMGELKPASLVVLGAATGNGFERVQPAGIRKLIALDINQEYLDVCRERFGARIPGLELVCADIASFETEPASIDFVHAALFLEYVEPAVVVEKASRWLKPHGIFAVVLQIASESCGKVSETGFASLKRLEPVMRLVDPARLATLAARYGFSAVKSETVRLESRKEFLVGAYRLEVS